MSCVLRLIGEYFDVDSFEKECNVQFSKKTHKGEPMFKTKPDDKRVIPQSSLSVTTSEAEFDDLDGQIKDTIKYLEANYDDLSIIQKTSDIEYAFLDFGIDSERKRFCQDVAFPPELVKLAGELKIGLTVSIYNPEYPIGGYK